MSLKIKLLMSYLLYIPFVFSTIYNVKNATEAFNYFKEKYSKNYTTAIEERIALKNFIFNLNKLENLNAITEDKDTFYIINQYADMNTKELNQHYAISIKPYYKVSNKNDAEYLGRSKNKEIKLSQLYDLDNAEELYKDYMVKYKKKNSTKKFDRQVHYYRFIKTLVELNNKYVSGVDGEIDDKADILKEPKEYYWPNY